MLAQKSIPKSLNHQGYESVRGTSSRRDAQTAYVRQVVHKMWWVYFEEFDYSFLAKIFILTKVQVSSAYHNYFELLNIGDLLQ